MCTLDIPTPNSLQTTYIHKIKEMKCTNKTQCDKLDRRVLTIIEQAIFRFKNYVSSTRPSLS